MNIEVEGCHWNAGQFHSASAAKIMHLSDGFQSVMQGHELQLDSEEAAQ